jgi:hypothetical protein
MLQQVEQNIENLTNETKVVKDINGNHKPSTIQEVGGDKTKEQRFIDNKMLRDSNLEEYFNKIKSGELPSTNNLIQRAIHWCMMSGFNAIPRTWTENDPIIVSFMPFTLFPSPLSRKHFDQIMNVQPHINKMVFKLARRPDLLEKALGSLIYEDNFIKNLWDIYNKGLKNGYNQQIFTEVLRTDYFLSHVGDNEFKMKTVEINTISSGLPAISMKASQLHK